MDSGEESRTLSAHAKAMGGDMVFLDGGSVRESGFRVDVLVAKLFR